MDLTNNHMKLVSTRDASELSLENIALKQRQSYMKKKRDSSLPPSNNEEYHLSSISSNKLAKTSSMLDTPSKPLKSSLKKSKKPSYQHELLRSNSLDNRSELEDINLNEQEAIDDLINRSQNFQNKQTESSHSARRHKNFDDDFYGAQKSLLTGSNSKLNNQSVKNRFIKQNRELKYDQDSDNFDD
jgi:hypothetical protein